ncbi:MBL fold metallo-hydrolase [Halorientalis sp.]|jgi:glyoxylase-like metal-dependent hydrolase (beta-lactamase superfamily II)|uniref:MBL fold metallo-hydrolase n=1 Tax=Halorientalis sp. TaxID=1931229 RepID=UPI0026149AFD|nr:MBL fold metallo-hydrolase [Halorientalis sp.]
MIVNLARGVRAFTSNAFLVDGKRTVIVDAGNEFDVVGAAREHVDDVDALVLTHTHPDHVGNRPDIVAEFDVDVWGYDTSHSDVDHAIDDGGTVQLGDHDYRTLHTPGHKDDHLCFYSETASTLFAGDLVFANGGFGRTDLAEGNRAVLIESVERLQSVVTESLGEMHTGHGPSVQTNPYQDIELAAQAARMG